MKTLLLRIEGKQSWGTTGRYATRTTEKEPTRSGIFGLILAAMGVCREDTEAALKELESIEMVVRVDREGKVFRDYQASAGGTLGRSLDRNSEVSLPSKGSILKQMKQGRQIPVDPSLVDDVRPGLAITNRYYIADASYLVALSGEDALMNRIADALVRPKFFLYLGRKACPVKMPVFEGSVDSGDPMATIESWPWPKRLGKRPDNLRVVSQSIDGQVRADLPISFVLTNRRHSIRRVSERYIPCP